MNICKEIKCPIYIKWHNIYPQLDVETCKAFLYGCDEDDSRKSFCCYFCKKVKSKCDIYKEHKVVRVIKKKKIEEWLKLHSI